jgi:hypothetical protein
MDDEAHKDFQPKFEEALSFVCWLHAEQIRKAGQNRDQRTVFANMRTGVRRNEKVSAVYYLRIYRS